MQSDAADRLILQRFRHIPSPSALGVGEDEMDSFDDVCEGIEGSKWSLQEQLWDVSPDGKQKSELQQQVLAPARRRPFDSDGDDDSLHGESCLPLKSGSGSGVVSPMSSGEERYMRECWALEGKHTSTRIRADSDSSPLPSLSPAIRLGSRDSLSNDERTEIEACMRNCFSENDKRTSTRIPTDSESTPLPSMALAIRRGCFDAADNLTDNVSRSDEEAPMKGLQQQFFDSDDDDPVHHESTPPLKSDGASGVLMSSAGERDMRELWTQLGKRTSMRRIRADSESSPLLGLSPPRRPGSMDSLSSDDRTETKAGMRHYLSVNGKRTSTRIRTDSESSPLPSMIPPKRKGSFDAAAENHNDEVSLSYEEIEDFLENDVAAPDSKKQRSDLEYRADDQWRDEDVDIKEEEGGKKRKGKLRATATALMAIGAVGYMSARALAQADDFDDEGGVHTFQDGGGAGTAQPDVSHAVQFDASQSVQVVPAPDMSQAAQAIPIDVSQVAQVAPIPAPSAPPVPTISPGELQVMQQMATQAASNAASAASSAASAAASASAAAGAGAAIAGTAA